jgi:heme/copper-type cytochrome/quinol oxidase subunit 1
MAADPASIAIGGEKDFYHAGEKKLWIFSWIFSTDHKRIGILYFVTMIFFFSLAVSFGVLMRLEWDRRRTTRCLRSTASS